MNLAVKVLTNRSPLPWLIRSRALEAEAAPGIWGGGCCVCGGEAGTPMFTLYYERLGYRERGREEERERMARSGQGNRLCGGNWGKPYWLLVSYWEQCGLSGHLLPILKSGEKALNCFSGKGRSLRFSFLFFGFFWLGVIIEGYKTELKFYPRRPFTNR